MLRLVNPMRLSLMMLLAWGGACLATAAQAQSQFGSSGPFISHKPQMAKPEAPPAPGLPGAAPDPSRIAPANQGSGLLSPTDALFDAINRGDIGSARDAINRGADLNGRNVLGLSPLDLAVDLGRNDISFLLLSMRGADPVPPSSQQTMIEAAPKPQKSGRKRLEVVHQAAAPRLPSARLFAGDGGTPQPDHGFLGFGGSRDAASP